MGQWIAQNQFLTFNNIANASSIISLIISIFIILNTKSIKNNLKLIARFKHFKQFNTDKKTILEELESSLNLIIKDEIIDLKNASDISRSLTKLKHYKSFMHLSQKLTLWRVNRLLASGINDKNKAELTMLLSKLVGFLELKLEKEMI